MHTYLSIIQLPIHFLDSTKIHAYCYSKFNKFMPSLLNHFKPKNESKLLKEISQFSGLVWPNLSNILAKYTAAWERLQVF